MKLISNLSIVSLFFIYGATGFAESKLVKSLDGAVATCPSKYTSDIPSKIMQLEILSGTESADAIQLELKVSVVHCEKDRWVLDPNPGKSSYQFPTPSGSKMMTVQESYSSAKLNVLTDERYLLKQFDINELFKSGVASVTLTLKRSSILANQLQLTIIGTKSVTSTEGYSETLPFQSGAYNLNLK